MSLTIALGLFGLVLALFAACVAWAQHSTNKRIEALEKAMRPRPLPPGSPEHLTTVFRPFQGGQPRRLSKREASATPELFARELIRLAEWSRG